MKHRFLLSSTLKTCLILIDNFDQYMNIFCYLNVKSIVQSLFWFVAVTVVIVSAEQW